MTEENIELSSFLKLAGDSLAEAQGSLLSGLNINSNMVLNNADLEVKVTVASERGQIVVKPVSSEDIRLGAIDPGVLSTLRISFVSTLEEPIAEATAATVKPAKQEADLINEVMQRKDIQKLATTSGDIRIKPTFVAEKSRWLVSVEDAKGTLLREMILPDM